MLIQLILKGSTMQLSENIKESLTQVMRDELEVYLYSLTFNQLKTLYCNFMGSSEYKLLEKEVINE